MTDADERGQQHERTVLAWIRTSLATVVVGLLMIRLTEPGVERWLVSAGTAFGVLGLLAVARDRTRRLQRERIMAAFGPVTSGVVVASLLLLNGAGLLLAL
jgi:uncharacterized membrane protein YidH (DUF202 family)